MGRSPSTAAPPALLSGGKPVAIGQRAYALLSALAAADGPVEKTTLIEAAWPGTIVEEMQSGYMIKERLLRPALVAVAKAPPVKVDLEG